MVPVTVSFGSGPVHFHVICITVAEPNTTTSLQRPALFFNHNSLIWSPASDLHYLPFFVFVLKVKIKRSSSICTCVITNECEPPTATHTHKHTQSQKQEQGRWGYFLCDCLDYSLYLYLYVCVCVCERAGVSALTQSISSVYTQILS